MNRPVDVAQIDLETWTRIRAHSVFEGVSDDEIRMVLPFFQMVRLESDEFLLEEGLDASIELYLVLTGKLNVIKEADKQNEAVAWGVNNEFVIARLTGGDVIGELSFIKGGPRSASIKSTSKSLLLSLSPRDLKRLEDEFPKVSSYLMKNMLGYVAQRLKQTSLNEVNALKIELRNSIINSKANIFFSYIIGLLCVYNLAIQLITTLSMDVNRTSFISAGIIIIFSTVLALMIWQSKLPTKMFGLTTKNWVIAVKESLFWSAVIIGVLITIKWGLIHYVPKYSHLTLFTFEPGHEKYHVFNFILYGLHSPIQEFIARGVLQGSLQHFFRGKNVTIRAIIISNALFSATHVHLLGGLLGVIVFVPGLFWGWLYSRHENLIGVSISHILIGWTALFFLNIESLF